MMSTSSQNFMPKDRSSIKLHSKRACEDLLTSENPVKYQSRQPVPTKHRSKTGRNSIQIDRSSERLSIKDNLQYKRLNKPTESLRMSENISESINFKARKLPHESIVQSTKIDKVTTDSSQLKFHQDLLESLKSKGRYDNQNGRNKLQTYDSCLLI